MTHSNFLIKKVILRAKWQKKIEKKGLVLGGLGAFFFFFFFFFFLHWGCISKLPVKSVTLGSLCDVFALLRGDRKQDRETNILVHP